MRKPLARLLTGWLLLLAGCGLMLDSGLVDLRTANRVEQATQAMGGFVLAVVGVMLRRGAMRRSQF